jgi:hypothetical protein
MNRLMLGSRSSRTRCSAANVFVELESIDVVILLNITLPWWKSRDLPFPRPSVIARRLNVSIRTVERRLVVLQRRGLITRLPSERLNGRTVRRFDHSECCL